MDTDGFTGEFSCSLDGKNRVNIPSEIRKKLMPEANNTLVFTRGFEMEELYAYPLNEWQRFVKQLRSLNPLEKKVRDFVRMFVGVSFKGAMDSQGRILIPERILKMGKIEKEMLIIGTLDKVELWNPEIYQQYKKRENLNLTDLAEEIGFKKLFDNRE